MADAPVAVADDGRYRRVSFGGGRSPTWSAGYVPLARSASMQVFSATTPPPQRRVNPQKRQPPAVPPAPLASTAPAPIAPIAPLPTAQPPDAPALPRPSELLRMHRALSAEALLGQRVVDAPVAPAEGPAEGPIDAGLAARVAALEAAGTVAAEWRTAAEARVAALEAGLRVEARFVEAAELRCALLEAEAERREGRVADLRRHNAALGAVVQRLRTTARQSSSAGASALDGHAKAGMRTLFAEAAGLVRAIQLGDAASDRAYESSDGDSSGDDGMLG